MQALLRAAGAADEPASAGWRSGEEATLPDDATEVAAALRVSGDALERTTAVECRGYARVVVSACGQTWSG